MLKAAVVMNSPRVTDQLTTGDLISTKEPDAGPHVRFCERCGGSKSAAPYSTPTE